MQLTSTAFQHEAAIPVQFTCDGDNISPELTWSDAPRETKSFALIMHDPDAPKPGGFTHWIMYDIPASVAALKPNMPKDERIPGTGVQGENDFGVIGYMGPCPPSGAHRYNLRLYALDVELGLMPGASHKKLLRAMQDHILEEAELMGKYARKSDLAA